MANPKNFNYTVPTEDVDGNPIALADIKQINLGLRPKSGTAGVYPIQFVDTTFLPTSGRSGEPLAAFGLLAPGEYVPSAQAVLKAGGISEWAVEGASFLIEPPVPKAPTAVSVV